jgi:hypothetical protein
MPAVQPTPARLCPAEREGMAEAMTGRDRSWVSAPQNHPVSLQHF